MAESPEVQLQSEVEALRRDLESLEREEQVLMEQIRTGRDDANVRDWKWIQEATKLTGVSVAECSASFCTFHFHPMFGGRGAEVYAMTVTFKEKGYEISKCFLPESIQLSDLIDTKPVNQLVRDMSSMVDSFVNRREQIRRLEDMFGESEERSISYTLDYMQVALRIKVSDGRSGFMINIGLGYHSNEILPFQVDFEVEGRELTDEEANDFEGQSHPFYVSPLFEAFEKAFQ